MNKIFTKIEENWSTFVAWMYSPSTMIEKARKSHLVFALMIFFLLQSTISFYISVAEDFHWIEQKTNPVVKTNINRINDLEKRLDQLEKK